MRKYDVVPEPPKRFIDHYQNESYRTTLRSLTGTMSKAIENNTHENNMKVKVINIAWILFLIGMIVASSFVVMHSL